VEFSSLALTLKEGIPAFLMKFQDCDSKLRLLGFLKLMGALGEVSRDEKYFKIREKFSYTIINYPADFHLYYCIVEQKCKNNITGKSPQERGIRITPTILQ
jgi:hypothetical protein